MSKKASRLKSPKASPSSRLSSVTSQYPTASAESHWTKKEAGEFREKLRRFRQELPEQERKTLNRILAGAVEAFRYGKKAGALDKRGGSSLAERLVTFRAGLPPRQRDAFTSIMASGAAAWGAAAEGGQSDVETIYMWHALLVPLAVITVGVVLIVGELSDDGDWEAPDLSNMPTSPEVPD